MLGQHGLAKTSFNYINSIIGSGVIGKATMFYRIWFIWLKTGIENSKFLSDLYHFLPGIPYALLQAGFGVGLILLVVIAWITDYSLVLMIRSGHLSGKFSYQGIMEAAFGSFGFLLLSFLQFVYPFIGKHIFNVVPHLLL